MADIREYPLASRLHGELNKIDNCWIDIPNATRIEFLSLPVITDTKGAKYDPAPVIGRATPILTYASSETRQISMDLPFITIKTTGSEIGSVDYNRKALRAIASAVYPRGGNGDCPYFPPVVCSIRFGTFLWDESGVRGGDGICVILDKYNVKNDPAVPSDPKTLIPYKFIVSTNWTVVYSSDDLPNQQLIYQHGK